jgi:hypothetical protein
MVMDNNEAREAIRKGYFKCTRDKIDIAVMRCLEFQREKICSCPLGQAIAQEKELIRERFDFTFGKRKKRTPKNAKVVEIDPRKIVFLPKPAHQPPDTEHPVVYDTPLGYYSHDKRVNTRKKKIPVALVKKSYEEIEKILWEVKSMEYREIFVREILPCPFQKRKNIKKDLDAMVEDIKKNGVINPIVVRSRKVGDKKWEIICGERRWLACQEAGIPTIPARVVEVDDIQARLMHLSENLQRKDLTPIERTEAIVDFVDAFLLADPEVGEEYEEFGEDEIGRVTNLLSKAYSIYSSQSQGYRPKDKTLDKFIQSLEKAFSQLSRPIEWQSFFRNDLILITQIDPEVKEVAVESKLSKAQAKELDRVKKEVPEAYEEIKEKIKESPREVSAEEIRAVREKESAKRELPKHPLTQLESEEFALLKRELGERWKELDSEQSETLLSCSGNRDLFRASLFAIKEELREKEEEEDFEYEPERVRQKKPTFTALEELRRKIESIQDEIKTALSLFREDEDDVDGFLNSAGKLLREVTKLKKSTEDEVYKQVARISANGVGEKVREYPWAKKLLESREKKPDPRIRRIKDAYTRLYIEHFKEKPTEADGKVAHLASQLLGKVEEEEVLGVLQFYLSANEKEIPRGDQKIYEKPRTFGKFFSFFAQIREHMRSNAGPEDPEVAELTQWYIHEMWEGNPPEDYPLVKKLWTELLPVAKDKAKAKKKDPMQFIKITYKWWKEVSNTAFTRHEWIIRGNPVRSLLAFKNKFHHICTVKENYDKWCFDYRVPGTSESDYIPPHYETIKDKTLDKFIQSLEEDNEFPDIPY